MNRKTIMITISNFLRELYTLDGLEKMRKMLDAGELMDVFSDAVDKAIEQEKVRIYQDTQHEN
jgi:hypothetical protein